MKLTPKQHDAIVAVREKAPEWYRARTKREHATLCALKDHGVLESREGSVLESAPIIERTEYRIAPHVKMVAAHRALLSMAKMFPIASTTPINPDPRLVASAFGASPIRDHVLVIVLEYETLAGKIRDARARSIKIWNSGLSRAEIQAIRRAVGVLEAAARR